MGKSKTNEEKSAELVQDQKHVEADTRSAEEVAADTAAEDTSNGEDTSEKDVDSEEDTERSLEEAETEDVTTGEDGNKPAKKGADKYPKSPKHEGVDPLTDGPKIPNPEV
jgi:hypothetical protein